MELYQVDSFTHVPFRGNPAAVCISDKQLNDNVMQQIAMEMNLSETAFLNKGDGFSSLRWFTPATEVTLCGHATLAAAYVLFSKQYLAENEEHRFKTASGELRVWQPEMEWLAMDFPLIQTQNSEIPLWIGEHFENVCSFATTEKNDIVELPHPDAVTDFRPDFALISRHTRQGLIITAKGNNGTDFVSRYFVPNVGVPEDPVTGSAHCELAHFWQKRLQQNQFKAYQASVRGGYVGVKITGDRVELKGQATLVFETKLELE